MGGAWEIMSCVNFVRIYISQSTGDPWFRAHNFIAIPIIASASLYEILQH